MKYSQGAVANIGNRITLNCINLKLEGTPFVLLLLLLCHTLETPLDCETGWTGELWSNDHQTKENQEYDI